MLAAMLLCGFADGVKLEYITFESPEGVIMPIIPFKDGSYVFVINDLKKADGSSYWANNFESLLLFFEAKAQFLEDNPELDIEEFGALPFGNDGGADVKNYYIRCVPKKTAKI